MGLIKIGEMYVDATRIKADSNRYSVMTTDKAEALIQLIDQQIEGYHKNVSQTDQNDAVVEDLIGQEIDGENLPGPLADLTTRRQKLLEPKNMITLLAQSIGSRMSTMLWSQQSLLTLGIVRATT